MQKGQTLGEETFRAVKEFKPLNRLMNNLPMTYDEIVKRAGAPVVAVVFGVGEPQGLAAMRGLGRAGIPVYAIGKESAVGFRSRYATEIRAVPDTHLDPAGVMKVVLDLGRKLKFDGIKAILLPTQDSMVELLSKNKTVLEEFFICHFPDSDVISACSDKKVQYETAERLGVPYPKTYFENQTDWLIDDLENKRVEYPLIFKARKELPRAIRGQYRLSIIKNLADLKKLLPAVAELKIPFIIQEIIPGEDDTLYTLGSCRTRKGELSAIFTGRKLRQTPPHFGVCRVGESKLVPELIGDGARLLAALNYFGISQVETKYDRRDGKYKLIEVNPRPWAWVGLPVEMGINLPYAFFCDALGLEIPKQEMTDRRCVYIYLYEDLYCSLAVPDGKPWVHLFRNYEMIVEPFFHTDDLKPGMIYFARCAGILSKSVFRKVFKILHLKRAPNPKATAERVEPCSAK
jgi:predicted ATP-grasp superfamily ATP-dependent carboligase